MTPAPTTRHLPRNGSSEGVFALKDTPKRGLKRRASREAVNPRASKRTKRGEPGALSTIVGRPRQLQVVPVSNSQKRPQRDGSLTFFVWGCGNDGSFGLGPDRLGEFPRPQRLDQQTGPGITSIVAGGMYTLLLDRHGKVKHIFRRVPSPA